MAHRGGPADEKNLIIGIYKVIDMMPHPALCRVLLAHVVVDAILWPHRFEEKARGRQLLRLSLFRTSTIAYAAVMAAALLPYISARWVGALIGFASIIAVRVGVLIAQISWGFPDKPKGLLKALEKSSPVFYQWFPRVLWQVLQLGADILVCWSLTDAVAPWGIPQAIALMPSVWVVLLTYSVAFWPAGTLVAALTRQWLAEIQNDDAAKGLQAGGLWIGRLERLLTVSFVLVNHPEAIAALVVAKGVIRFAEIKEASNRRVAEYILIGSMLSFGIALLLGWSARHLVTP